jgi:hypothetical protein
LHGHAEARWQRFKSSQQIHGAIEGVFKTIAGTVLFIVICGAILMVVIAVVIASSRYLLSLLR